MPTRQQRSSQSPEKAARKKSPPDAEALEAAALRYLDRYDASVEQLRRVLLRRVDRQAAPDVVERVTQDIERLLERYQGSRLLDDNRYAEHLARGLRERGASTLRIRQKLRQRGVASEIVDQVLENSAGSKDALDLMAAKAYARRRRLADRYDLQVPAQRQKALAALARQGFSFEVALRALAPKDEDVF